MRKFIIALVLLIGVVFILTRIADIEEVVLTLRQGDWHYVALALIVQILWLTNVAVSFYFIFRALGLSERIDNLLVLSSAANFVNVVAPTAGMGGIAVFISEARRKGYSTARVTVAGGLFILFEYVGFLIIFSMGLYVLFQRNRLNAPEIGALVTLASIAIAVAFLLYLGARSGETLGRALAWLARMINRILRPFIRREYLSETRAHNFAIEAANGISQLRYKPQNLMISVSLSLSSKLLLIITLLLIFLAFKVPYTISILIASFSLAYLFWFISPTPAGMGFVEGALTLGLRSLSIPLSVSTVLAVAYRGVTFWFPLFIGMLAFRWLSRKNEVDVTA